jgi:hypothetical protein
MLLVGHWPLCSCSVIERAHASSHVSLGINKLRRLALCLCAGGTAGKRIAKFCLLETFGGSRSWLCSGLRKEDRLLR